MSRPPKVAADQPARSSRRFHPVSAEQAAWLSDEILLLICRPVEDQREPSSDAPTAAFEARRLMSDIAADEDPASAALYAVEVPAAMLGALSEPFGLIVDDESLSCEGSGAVEALTDIRSLARERLAAWSPTAREELLMGLSSLARGHTLSRSLSDGLFGIREALRERQPLAVPGPGAERMVEVEQLHRIDRHGFYVRGWLLESSPPLDRLDAISPEGERVELLNQALRHPRPDLQQRFGLDHDAWNEDVSGFVCHFAVGAPSRRADGWIFELVNARGRGVETATPLTSTDPDAASEAVVADVELAVDDRDALIKRHVRPTLTRLQELRRERVSVATSEEHGNSTSRPEVSIVVPLDRRIDLLEHQLAQFADDPELDTCELIYVLCCTDRNEQLRELANELFHLYGLPFRLVTLTASGDPAVATNIGAEVATGGQLMLLNAEVIPAERGWLGRMSSFFSATPRIGALAPKLLYEDGAIDQAGIDFVRPGSGSEWAPRRRFRGLHGMLPAANVAQAIAAVGHDCVMVEARAFVDSGGLGSHYLTSAYQGAELCLRLNEAGLESWYIPQVELHRLDDHAGAPEKDTPSALYDRWLFSQRHGHSIERSAGAISGSVVRREQGRRCGARGSLVHRACAGTVGLPVDARVAKLRAKPWDSDRFRPWASEYSEIPRELFSISGMLSTQERQMLYYLARHDFVGEGVIADMGTYLGASTMCFAAGVRQRSFRGPIIHTYDLFKLGDSQPEVDHFPGVLPVNSGTRPVFEANLREYLNLIVVHEGDILDETWDGDPIEFLFIDLAKSYKVLDHLLLAFFPALIPSRSLVVMQDYLWATAGPWHHIVLEKLGAYFEYVVDTDVASVVFMLTRKIPLSVLEQCLYMRIPRAEKIELMDRAIEKLDTPEKRRFLSASRELLLSGKDEQWGMYYHVL